MIEQHQHLRRPSTDSGLQAWSLTLQMLEPTLTEQEGASLREWHAYRQALPHRSPSMAAVTTYCNTC